MKIRVATLKEGLNQWSQTFDPVELGLEPSFTVDNVNVGFTADKRPGKIDVVVAARAHVKLVCDRCGDEFQSDVGSDYSVHFIQRESPLDEEAPGDEMRSFAPGQHELDVSCEIRDAIALALPMKLLCRDECRGLCPRCGANLNYETCACTPSS